VLARIDDMASGNEPAASRRQRCAAHGLVYDASLQAGCVLCRKVGNVPGQRSNAASSWLVPVLLLATLAGGLWAVVRWRESSSAVEQAAKERAPSVSEATEALAPTSEAEDPAAPSAEQEPTFERPAEPSFEEPAAIASGSAEARVSVSTVPLTERAAQSSLAEVQRRVGWSDEDVSAADEDYDVTKESFDLVVPSSYEKGTPHALLVWISESNVGLPPAGYEATLAKHRVIWAGARKSGNRRKPPVRVNLSLDVAAAVSKSHDIDAARVWVGGFSGGGRSASKAALLYPDMFHGGLFVCGADYVRTTGPDPSGKRWKSQMPNPDGNYYSRAKQGRFVLLTGERDPNRIELTQLLNEYEADGFSRVKLTTTQQGGHQMPPAGVFGDSLAWLKGE
jgi:hypothetical protein